MTRSELIERLAKRQPSLTLNDVDLAVRSLFEQIAHTLADGGRAEIRGFGSFSLRHLSAHIGRNPKTGESVEVPGKSRVHFKPGTELRERVNAAFSEQENDTNAGERRSA